jgi:hypothetical protein
LRYHFLVAGVVLIVLGLVLLFVKCFWFRQPLPFVDEVGATLAEAAGACNEAAGEGRKFSMDDKSSLMVHTPTPGSNGSEDRNKKKKDKKLNPV